MADPVTLAMVGAAAGAALKPKDPLKGAMLGATVGFTGGSALGAAGVGATGAAAGGVTGGTGLATGGSALGTGTGIGLTAPATTTGIGLAAPTSVGLTAPAAATSGYGLTAATAAPSFMQQLGSAGSYMKDNPMQTLQTAQGVQGLLTPEPMPQTPMGQVQRGQPMSPVNFAALLNPQQYKPQPISLLG
jgi:hypothetical protein